MEEQHTYATVANMRLFESTHKSRTLPSGATIEGKRCFAVSLSDPYERCAASSGDYFNLADDEPLRDTSGEPMVLVTERCMLLDALTGEEI